MSYSVNVPERLLGHLQKGHPWLYRDIVPPALKGIPAGTVVQLRDAQSKLMGHALYDPTSPIALRILSMHSAETIDAAFFLRRIRAARALRQPLLKTDTTTFRLIHGEGDRLPGIVVDCYQEYLVLKLDTPAWLPHLPMLAEILQEEFCPAGIYFRGVTGDRHLGNLSEVVHRVLSGSKPEPTLVVRENGMQLEVNILEGQKTGFFIDQRENRQLVSRYARSKRVLNLFCYTGGFSIAAGLAGAQSVSSVDIAPAAIAALRRNLELNKLELDQHRLVAQDVFEFIHACHEQRQDFDLVVVDPPSFAPNEKSLKPAQRAYVRLNSKAMRLIRPGGILATASCSSHVTMVHFIDWLREASGDAHRSLRLIEVRHEPADHPVPLHFPEGHYLKFIMAIVD